jgi:hypothetical protein
LELIQQLLHKSLQVAAAAAGGGGPAACNTNRVGHSFHRAAEVTVLFLHGVFMAEA